MNSPNPALQEVTPRDCALALTIPLTREQFLSDLAQTQNKDYAAHVKRRNFKPRFDDDYYWDEVYRPLPRIVGQICNEVEKRGVTVKRSLMLSELPDLLKNFKVITLIAHWRFSKIRPEEITDPNGFLAALHAPQNEVQRAVRQEIMKSCPELLNEQFLRQTSEEEMRGKTVAAINPIIAAAHALYRQRDSNDTKSQSAGVHDDLLTEVSLLRLTRVAFEQAFPTQIAASRAIEFSDGLHNIAQFVETIPDNFDGLLDLTVCNSVIVGEVIKFNRPKCLVAVNRYPTQPHVRLAFYKLAIEMLSRRPALYIDVLTKLHTRRF